MSENDSPTMEEKAKFVVENSIKHIGYVEVLEQASDARYAGEALEEMERSTAEGAQRVMRNKREHGFHPINAWEFAMEDEYPEWFMVSLAESEHQSFARDPDFMTDEEQEYVEYLEDNFGVPK